MSDRKRAIVTTIAAFGALGMACGPANAQSAAEFYKGKTVTLAIGAEVGGTIDLNGRLIGRHMGKYLPGNPAIVVQNVPGASSLKLANHLAAGAPKDGSYIGGVNRIAVFRKLYMENSGVTFDPLAFNYLGSPDKIWSVAYVWHTAKAKKAEDLLIYETVVGGSPGGSSQLHPQMFNEFAGFKYKIINGYKGGADVDLAAERGEVEGRASTAPVALLEKNWVADKQVTLLYWNGLEKNMDLWPDLPLGLDLIKNPDDRKLMELYFAADETGYPYTAPPGVPADRVAALRKAFMDTMTDKAFVDESAKQKLDVNPVSAEKLTRIITESYGAPQAIVKRLQAVLASTMK